MKLSGYHNTRIVNIEENDNKSSERQIKAERDNAQKWLKKWGSMPEFNQYGMICGLKK